MSRLLSERLQQHNTPDVLPHYLPFGINKGGGGGADSSWSYGRTPGVLC